MCSSSASRVILVFGTAVAIALALVTASVLGSRSSDAEPVALAEAAETEALLRGIPQDGIALGSPDAPVTLVEYADLQCPYCAQWAREAFPAIVDEYVRPGRVRLVFRGLAFIGPESEVALRAALAAGRQDRLWNLVHALYGNQGAENGGWVTEDFLHRLGHQVRGLDPERMRGDALDARRARAGRRRTSSAGGGHSRYPCFRGRPDRGHPAAARASLARRGRAPSSARRAPARVSDRALRAAVAAIALGGAAIAAYLLWARWAGAEPVCTTGGCGTVQSSSYAEVLGAPVPLLGLAGFLLIGATALGTTPLMRAAGAGLALAAVVFSGYLLVIQLAVIDAVCDWCLASDVITTALAALALLRLREGLAGNPQAGSA